MTKQYKYVLIITLLINLTFFVYYLLNSDINPSIDAFYYLSIADSFHQGTGFVDITTVPAKPVLTPQNGIVFIYIILKYFGLQNATSSLLIIKIYYYLGFLLALFIFYRICRRLQVSSELTVLSVGILLASAHFFKTADQPLNEGMWVILTMVVCYLAILNDRQGSFLKVAAIAVAGIVLANFRLNGPVIILAIAAAYFLLGRIRKSFIFLGITAVSYASVYLVLAALHIDVFGFKGFVSGVYSLGFLLYRPLITLIYTIPGAFLGATGRWMNLFYTTPGAFWQSAGGWLIFLPFSLGLLVFYGFYLKKAFQENNFPRLLIISYLILLVLVLQIMPGGDSRYIIMIVPFTLLALVTYFDDGKWLRICLGLLLLLTISSSIFRLTYWDRIYFANNQAYARTIAEITGPFTLVSQAPRYSYYIFGQGSHNLTDITPAASKIVVFGQASYDKKMINLLRSKLNLGHIQYLTNEFVTGHGPQDRYRTVVITTK